MSYSSLRSEQTLRIRSGCDQALAAQSALAPLFSTIPPERMGLQGEYDHSGLAKRVILAFDQQFNSSEISSLSIYQRGAIVVLIGTVSTQRFLNELVNVAMGVSGAVGVEVNGVNVFQPPQAYFHEPDCLRQPSFAF